MYKKLWRIRHVLLIILMLSWYTVSFAQTLTTDEPAPQKIWEIMLKLGFPVLMTAVSPWLQGLITSSIKKVPPTVQVAISSILGLIIGGIAGAIPDFPLTIESAATMGIASGGTGQVLVNMQSGTMHPKVGEAGKPT